MDDLLYQYNPWWEDEVSWEGIRSRDRYVAKILPLLSSRRAILLNGLRRVGKSTIMKLLARSMIESGVTPTSILYVSLDDYQIRSQSILDVIDAFRKLHHHPMDRSLVLLLDEIAVKTDFHQQLKTLIDREDVRIVAASSSSSVLRDQGAQLTGRSVAIEVLPLTFEEYLEFRDIHVARRDQRLLDGYFQDYVRDGGLPEHVLFPGREYLMSLVDDIIQKDITAYHGLRDPQIVRDYFTLLMERSGKQVSINKIGNILKLSPDTSRRYLGYFHDAFLIHLVPRKGTTNERLLSPKKVYACDLGVKYLFIGERDWGSYFENYVYLRLRPWQSVSYVLENDNELDFLTEDGTLIEAKYNADLFGRQKEAFERFDARRKFVLRNIADTKDIDAFWE